MQESDGRRDGEIDPKLLEILARPLTKATLEWCPERRELVSRPACLLIWCATACRSCCPMKRGRSIPTNSGRRSGRKAAGRPEARLGLGPAAERRTVSRRAVEPETTAPADFGTGCRREQRRHAALALPSSAISP